MYRVFFALVLAVSITAINVDAQYPYCGVCQAPPCPVWGGPGTWSPDPADANEVIYGAFSFGGASNGGGGNTFTLESERTITRIVQYHWNGGSGAPPGTI
jgi:hypothetical protein